MNIIHDYGHNYSISNVAARALMNEYSKDNHIIHSALRSGIHSVDFERMTTFILKTLKEDKRLKEYVIQTMKLE